MDINDNQQQNTFESGMNMDTADYVLAKNQYRMAKNLRLVTDNSGNSAELHFIDGNKFLSAMPPKSHIVATDSVRDVGVVVVQGDQDSSGWNIFVVKDLGDDLDIKQVFSGGISERLDETYPIDTLLRYEADDNIKLYIADSTHPLIAVNIASVGQKNVSIEDIISYPLADLQAPKFAGFIAGTLTAGLYLYAYRLYNKRGSASEMSKTTKLIPVVKANSGGTYDGYEKGTLTTSGIAILIPLDDNKLSRMYVYRIRYTEVGLLPTIELIKDANVSGVTEYTVNDTGNSALSTLTLEEFNSVSGVHIIPKTIESKNDYLFAAGIKQQDSEIDISGYDARTYSYYYDASAGAFKLKIDGKIRSGSIKKELATSTIARFDTNRNRIVYYSSFANDDTADCKLDSDAKYVPWVYEQYNETTQYTTLDWVPLYGGIGNNIRWRFVIGLLDADYTLCCGDLDSRPGSVVHQRARDKAKTADCAGTNSNHWTAISRLEGSDYTTTEDYKYKINTIQTGNLLFGSNDGLIRKTQRYNNPGKCYKGVLLNAIGLSFKNESYPNGVVLYHRDNLIENISWENDYVTDFSKADYDEYNYANPKVSYLYKSLRRGETYRFGIIFYDRFGRSTKVKWILDVVVPELYEPGFETFVSNEVSHCGFITDLSVRPLGIQFDVMDLPDGAVGYEIVRCNRTSANIKNLAQGVLSKPVRRHLWLNSDISSQVYCPTGYLTTGRFLLGSNNYYWSRCYHSEPHSNGYGDSADNFDNFDTYQFVSAETTYQPTSTYQLLDSIGRSNLKLLGLKCLFGLSQTQPLYFSANPSSDSTSVLYNYTYCAHAMELGHYNSTLYLPHVSLESIATSVITTHNVDVESQAYAGYERSLMWLGLDVICNMYGALLSSHRPFWRDIISFWGLHSCDGYRDYKNNLNTAGDVCHTTKTTATNTTYTALQYIKLYEQSNDVTYRTPVLATLGPDNPGTQRTCLGYCILSHSLGNHNNLWPNSNPSEINGGKDSFNAKLPDYSTIGRSHAYNLNAEITNFCTAKTISRQGLFKAPENNNLNLNLDNTTISNSIQFFNATVGPIYALSIDYAHYTTSGYGKSTGLDDGSRAYSYDISLGGPCLLIKLAETENDSKEKHTFANTSAAYTVLTHRGDFEALCSVAWNNSIWSNNKLRQPNSPKMDRNNSDNWYSYDYGGTSSKQNHLTDAYGTYDVLRIRINKTGNDPYGDYLPIFRNSIAGTILCNILLVPVIYSGTTHTERELDTYYSYGDYHKAKRTGYDSAIVFNGDCYIQLLEYVSAHKYSNPADYYGSNDGWLFLKTPLTRTTVYSIPVETNINIEYEYGHSVSKAFDEGIDSVIDIATPELEPYTMSTLKSDIAESGTIVQNKPMYQYNSAYSANPTSRLFSVYTDDDTNTSLQNYDCRCYYSNVKENNESIDSWLKFMSSNYLDVDTRYGGINKLRTFNNQLLFWQDSAFGVFSVNEQRLIQDANNSNLILGEGGVLLRYDYISTIYGMNKYQITDTLSDSRIYWFDHDNNTLLAYAQGSLAEISTTGNVRCYLSDITKRYSNIKLVYDNEYSEVRANINSGESLVYNEDQSVFTAVYDSAKDPVWFINLPTGILGITSNSFYKENERETAFPGRAADRRMYGLTITPEVTFISNNIPNTVKVFDITTFGGTFSDKSNLKLSYTTPNNQKGETSDITNREWDYRVAIPRDGDADYGRRLRDKTLTCTISSNNSAGKFSLEYVITKYRLSCS